MTNREDKMLENLTKNVEEIKNLLIQSVVIKLYLSGASQDEIAKSMKMGKVKINKIVKGIKKVKK